MVHFGDGTKEELGIAECVRPGGKTREIELPGERRTIDGVEPWYSKENLDTRPEVGLYATRWSRTAKRIRYRAEKGRSHAAPLRFG